ncbi:hypothetical protein [Saccharococcus sp. Marseille-Q5394]|uniref:hypothetical protein n=1 Tax=Saccharococcus sp. Marseille-Q5394 TaxID=2972778 RepID=UPI0021CA1F8E|nr:hypothetical protein [Saccharococcus sp. Marseille-Q5394]
MKPIVSIQSVFRWRFNQLVLMLRSSSLIVGLVCLGILIILLIVAKVLGLISKPEKDVKVLFKASPKETMN